MTDDDQVDSTLAMVNRYLTGDAARRMTVPSSFAWPLFNWPSSSGAKALDEGEPPAPLDAVQASSLSDAIGARLDRAMLDAMTGQEAAVNRARIEEAKAGGEMDFRIRAPLTEAAARSQEIAARQQRLMDEEWVAAYPQEAARDKEIEQARLNIAGALSRAVGVGLLTEDRAVSMIAIGGLNDRALTASGGLSEDEVTDMVAQVLQQGVRGGVFSEIKAQAALAALGIGIGQSPPLPPSDPEELTAARIKEVARAKLDRMAREGEPVMFRDDERGRGANVTVEGRLDSLADDGRGGWTAAARPSIAYSAVDAAISEPNMPPTDPDLLTDEDELGDLALLAGENWPIDGNAVDEKAVKRLVRAIPRLVATVQRLTDMVLDAATIEPCHAPPHRQLHDEGPTVCEYQQASVGLRLLRSFGFGSMALFPRRRHTTDDGEVSPCCARNGNIGTWVKYGQMLTPGLTPTRTGPLGGVDPFLAPDDDELPF